jgi:hypothetical protein
MGVRTLANLRAFASGFEGGGGLGFPPEWTDCRTHVPNAVRSTNLTFSRPSYSQLGVMPHFRGTASPADALTAASS